MSKYFFSKWPLSINLVIFLPIKNHIIHQSQSITISMNRVRYILIFDSAFYCAFYFFISNTESWVDLIAHEFVSKNELIIDFFYFELPWLKITAFLDIFCWWNLLYEVNCCMICIFDRLNTFFSPWTNAKNICSFGM